MSSKNPLIEFIKSISESDIDAVHANKKIVSVDKDGNYSLTQNPVKRAPHGFKKNKRGTNLTPKKKKRK